MSEEPQGNGDAVARLVSMPAGPGLLAAASAVDVGDLGAHDVVLVIAAWERATRWAGAGQLAAIAKLPECAEYQLCDAPRAEVERPHSHQPIDPAGDELSLALTVSPNAAKATIAAAQDLVRDLPDTWQAVADGELDVRRATLLAERTRVVADPRLRREVEALVLPGASARTYGQLDRAVRRAVLALDPAAAEARRAVALASRRVEAPRPDTLDAIDGMARMQLVGPAEDLVALYTAADAAARHHRGDGDARSLDQLRFDILTDVAWNALDLGHLGCCAPTCANATGSRVPATGGGTSVAGVDDAAAGPAGGGPAASGAWRLGRRHGRAATVNVTVPASLFFTGPTRPASASGHGDGNSADGDADTSKSADGDADTSKSTDGDADTSKSADGDDGGRPNGRLGLAGVAELEGYGPITRTAARTVARRATVLHRMLTDDTGQPLAYARRSYRPPPELVEYILARDLTCRFPTCTAPARASDLDHRLPWSQGGTTDADNLWALHQGHHVGKTQHRFRTTADPTTGELYWITPAGHAYPVHPDHAGLVPPIGSDHDQPTDPPPF